MPDIKLRDGSGVEQTYTGIQLQCLLLMVAELGLMD